MTRRYLGYLTRAIGDCIIRRKRKRTGSIRPVTGDAPDIAGWDGLELPSWTLLDEEEAHPLAFPAAPVRRRGTTPSAQPVTG